MQRFDSTYETAETVADRLLHPFAYLAMRRAIKRRLNDVARSASRAQRVGRATRPYGAVATQQ